MKFEVLIDPKGNVQHHVLERGDQNCSDLVKIAQLAGTVTADEHTGPECDSVSEVQV